MNQLIQQLKNGNITLKQFFDNYHIKYLNNLLLTNKIAIIQFRALGDAILLSGFIREVKLNNPGKELVLICDTNNYPIFKDCPYTSEIIVLNIQTENMYQFIDDMQPLLLQYFLQYRFDKIFCMQIGVNNLFAMVCAN